MTDPRQLGLTNWGDALRAERRFRRRLRRCATPIGVLAVALAATIARPPRPLLLWNASASAPLGLYAVSSAADVATGDTVIARVPEPMRQLAAQRRYLPVNVPLVKRVSGEPGDSVCAVEREIYVNGRWVAERLTADAARRPMPWWSGCMTLRRGALFLLMADSPASFDGRYFGPSEREDLIGKATLLWAR